MGSKERYLLAAARIRLRSVVATISYGLGVAAQVLLQKSEMAVALEADRNSRLVVVVFNYFYLSTAWKYDDLPRCNSVKIIPIFLDTGMAMTMKGKAVTM
jgi:hypothetical protein